MAGSDDIIDWREEANAVIQDVSQHVHSISVSNIPSSEKKIYFNMTILELKDFCVELTQEGFQVVGEKYDSEDERGKYLVFETLYSLLDSLSPAYRNSFSEELLLKLKKLEGEQEKEQDFEDERRAFFFFGLEEKALRVHEEELEAFYEPESPPSQKEKRRLSLIIIPKSYFKSLSKKATLEKLISSDIRFPSLLSGGKQALTFFARYLSRREGFE